MTREQFLEQLRQALSGMKAEEMEALFRIMMKCWTTAWRRA